MKINKKDLIKYFGYKHLPGDLQIISKKFHDTASFVIDLTDTIEASTPAYDQIGICLQKLLEAKDCAVRACLK